MNESEIIEAARWTEIEVETLRKVMNEDTRKRWAEHDRARRESSRTLEDYIRKQGC